MNLEMQTGNLTCGASDANYRIWRWNAWNYNYYNNCTAYAWYVRGNPGRALNDYYYQNLMQQLCATDGRTAAYRVEFEMQSCNRSQGSYHWLTYHSCCYSKYICLYST
jgi:hypothetical protein